MKKTELKKLIKRTIQEITESEKFPLEENPVTIDSLVELVNRLEQETNIRI